MLDVCEVRHGTGDNTLSHLAARIHWHRGKMSCNRRTLGYMLIFHAQSFSHRSVGSSQQDLLSWFIAMKAIILKATGKATWTSVKTTARCIIERIARIMISWYLPSHVRCHVKIHLQTVISCEALKRTGNRKGWGSVCELDIWGSVQSICRSIPYFPIKAKGLQNMRSGTGPWQWRNLTCTYFRYYGFD